MTNPQKKKKKKQEIIEVWTELKTKLITTLTELKANHKDQWAVVKPKSVSQWVKIIPPQQLGDVQYCLRELALMDNRPPNQMLSSTDQVKYDSLKKRLKDLKEESIDSGWRKLLENQNNLIYTQQKAQEDQQELEKINTKYRQLNIKLNWLRTLVRAGDINQLQELVRQAKI